MAKKPVNDQMELFENGGFKDQGNTKDPISNNPVPVGSTKKEVRDDIPANLSEGEFVLPADVVRYHGLEKIMGFRDQAKQGLQKMEDMGQMGNSNQAVLPEGTPFRKMAVGGLNPAVQAPQIQAPSVIPEEVPGVQYNPVTQQGLRPSVYSYGTQMPQVDRPQEDQKQQQPDVTIPTVPQYGAQARPAYRQPTNTAATPTFKNLIGTDYGQLQKSETIKYVNPDTDEELYIPFVDGKPIYPIPTGFVPADEAQKEKEKEKAGEVKTTSVRQEGEGSDGYESTMDTSVTGGFYSDPQTFDYDLTDKELADLAAGRTPSTTTTRGVGVLDTLSNNAKGILGGLGILSTGPLGIGLALGSMLGGSKEKDISTSVQSDRLGTLGYTTQTDKNNLAQQLGIDLNNTTTMARGHNVGNINNADPNSVYSSKGVSVNVNKGHSNYGAVTGYTGPTAAINAVTAMADAGYYGNIESIANMGGYAMSNPAVFSGMNKGREAIGLNSISQQQAMAALDAVTPTNSLGQPNYGNSLGPGTAVTANGVYSGGYFSMNNFGGKSVLGYTTPGRGTVFSRDEKGRITSITDPTVGKTDTARGRGKGLGSIDVTPDVDTPTTGAPTASIDTGRGIDSITDTDISDTSTGFGMDTSTSPGNVDDVTSGLSPFGSDDDTGPTTDNTQGPTDSGVGDDSDDDSTGKIVCTTMNRMYGLPMYSNKVWMRYNKYKNLDSAWELGYHKIFLSLVKKMPTNKYIRGILEWLAKNRTHGVKEEMKGNIFTTNTLLIRPILGPVVYITGKLIQKGILKKVNVKGI